MPPEQSDQRPSDDALGAAAKGRVWHYVLDDEAFGPVDASGIEGLVGRGLLDAEGLIWREGWERWRPLAEVEELAASAPRRTPTSERAPPRTGALAGGAWRLFALRLGAALIDQLLLLVPTILLTLPVMFLFLARGKTVDQLSSLTFADPEWWILFGVIWNAHWVYAALMESGPWRATLGKRVCGLVVSDAEGRRLGFGRASGRYWAKVLSSPFYLGYLLALATGGARALHDMIAGTSVVEHQPLRRPRSARHQPGARDDRGGLDPEDVRPE